MTRADHYGTLPAALAYHEARGNAAWTAADVDNDDKRTAALVRASQALGALHGARFSGVVASADQDLLWPRASVSGAAKIWLRMTCRRQ
ncbi:MAG TPA: DnaT-like ssDNA-binding protein [Pseudorhizobium sp.]|nr:DnaT-like ssDNA-binding protein [Pseudorhizobium sp.]